jgi:hypothetical protein
MAAEVIDYEAVLADLEAKRAALDSAIIGIRQVLSLGALSTAIQTGSKEQSAIESDSFFGMSIGDAAKKYLRMMKRKQPAAKIAEALDFGGLQHTSKSFPNTVRTTLIRLESEGEVVQVGKEWGLAEWYPGLRKGKKSEKESGRETSTESESPDQ